MKFLFAVALIACLVVPVMAEDGCDGGCLDGYDCQNACPLAQQANLHRATGNEALAISSVARRSWLTVIEGNLERI